MFNNSRTNKCTYSFAGSFAHSLQAEDRTVSGQNGFVLSRWLVFLMLVGSIAYLAITFGGVYLDHGRVVESIESSLPSPEKIEASKTMDEIAFESLADSVKRTILRRLEERDLTHIKPTAISVERNYQNMLVVVCRYETRKHWLGNLDYVANFQYRSDIQ